jgi:type I restriction enzyme R subunit
MVFCVDTAHAELTARLLNDHFADLGYDDYAYPIVAKQGEDAKVMLRRFQDSDQRVPVIATTAELLSTGVDVPACRNIVFMKTVSSPVLFKQIVGRGSRIDASTGKFWFRVVDYTDATRLFDSWDRPPLPPDAGATGPETAVLQGRVYDEERDLPIQGAALAVLLGPNTQRGPLYTDAEGAYHFAALPAGVVTLLADGPGYNRRRLQVELLEDEVQTVDVALKRAGAPAQKIRVTGLEVEIAEEAVFLIEGTGQSLSLQEYEDYTRRQVLDLTAAQGLETLRETWIQPDRRQRFLERLRAASVHPEVLAEVKGLGDADTFDLLAHLTYNAPVRTRDERVQAFRNRQQRFLERYSTEAREVLLALLEKYRAGGVEQIADPQIFRLPPFDAMGEIVGVTRRFGDVAGLRDTLEELQERLYA